MSRARPNRSQGRYRPAIVAPAVCAAALLTACGGDPTPPPPPPVATSITISPSSVTFTAVGDTEQLSAEVRDQYGSVMVGARVNWSSLRPTVATVDLREGLVTAAGAGTATITARSGSASAEASVTVDQEVEAMEKTGGDAQAGHFFEALPIAPAVRVLDRNGHPAGEITVSFEVTSGGGSAAPASVVTRRDGIAETIWTLGDGTVQTLTASAAGLTAEFEATASRLPVTIATDSLPQGRATLEYAETLKVRGGSGGGYAWMPERRRPSAGGARTHARGCPSRHSAGGG